MTTPEKKLIYPDLITSRQAGLKKLAVLIDPDKVRLSNLDYLIKLAIENRVNYFFVGGSLIVNNMLDYCLDVIAGACKIPIVLFPGNSLQLSDKADAILFLSLISGRNPELLIGNHVIAAPMLKQSRLEIIPTGYMLIDGGVETTASYISNTKPIPSKKTDIAVCTAMAGEMLGLKLIYLDAGSGAIHPVSEAMIQQVTAVVDIPVIVGGGISTPEQALKSIQGGADLLVIGNALEKDPSLIHEIASAVHRYSMQQIG
jgi:putative glycerol-1-phosphate prenyltransferase